MCSLFFTIISLPYHNNYLQCPSSPPICYLLLPLQCACTLTACPSSSLPCPTAFVPQSLSSPPSPTLISFPLLLGRSFVNIACPCPLISFTLQMYSPSRTGHRPLLHCQYPPLPDFTYCSPLFSPRPRLLFSTAPQALSTPF